MEDEEDFSAQSLFDLIADTLSRYEKPRESVAFMVEDSCAASHPIGGREGVIHLVECASHRIRVTMGDYLEEEENPSTANVCEKYILRVEACQHGHYGVYGDLHHGDGHVPVVQQGR